MLDRADQPYSQSEQHFTRLELGVPPQAVPETTPNPRQQNKIVAYLERHDPQVLNQPEVEVTAHERHDVLQALAHGTIGAEEIRTLLRDINKPARSHPEGEQRGMNHTFNIIALDPQQRGILAEFTRTHDAHTGLSAFEQRDTLTPTDLANFLVVYPDPSVFEPQIELFLSDIEHDNSPEKRAQYETKMRSFLETVYGKQLEYWEQIKLLQREALQDPDQGQITASVQEREALISSTLDTTRKALDTALLASAEGHEMREALKKGLDGAVTYSRDLGLPEAVVLHYQNLNLSVPQQRADIDAMLHALGTVVNPGDSPHSRRSKPDLVTTDDLPFLADELSWLYPEEAGNHPHGAYVVMELQADNSRRVKEIHLSTGIPDVTLVADGDGIDGTAEKGRGVIRLMLQIDMHQVKKPPQ